MPIHYTALKNRRFEDVHQRYSARDTILYALGIGMGADPTDLDQLRYVVEADLRAMPTQAVVLGSPGFWMQSPDTGLDWQNILHVDQELTLHQTLPASGEVVGKTTVEALVDKRASGAMLYTRCDVFDAATLAPLATTRSGNLCRSDGHFEGGDTLDWPVHKLPKTPPDLQCDLPSTAQAALIYRLSGDHNPLHVDIKLAQQAGFERPFMQGLGTFGMAGHAALRMLCAYEPSRLKKLRARFSAPFYPGETLRTVFWTYGDGTAGFQCHSLQRGVMVINNGWVEYMA
jgi:acyl dehydratase